MSCLPLRARSFVPASPRIIASLTPLAVAVVLLCCTLGVLLGARPAHAQAPGGGPTGQSSLDVGVVDNLTITTSVDGAGSVTTPVNTDATFTATASAGTPRFVGVTPGWTIVGPATYNWYIATDAPGAQSAAAPAARSAAAPAASPPTLAITYSPANTAKTTVTIPGVSPAQTAAVTITCAVTYGALGPDGKQPGYLVSSVSKTITVYVIGGPISGENNIYWFCDSSTSTDWGHLAAASGQPAGTTYSWSLAGNAQLTSSSTSASVTYAGSGGGSTNVGDVKATVTYSLNGVTATSDPFPITVHAPVHFIVVPPNDQPIAYTSGPKAYGFDGQHLHFRITDGLNQPVTSAHSACWDEIWALSGNGNGPLPNYIGDVLDSAGASTDYFRSYGSPQPTDPAGDKVTGPFTHSYYVTDQGGGASGGGVGCPVQVYTNVIYKTYGVVGNGF